MAFIQKLFIFSFFGFIAFPWINKFIPFIKTGVSNENRALAFLPKIDTCETDLIPKFVENYLVDRLSTRNNMIRFYNRLNIFVFKSSPVSIKAFIGKSGWLFLSGEELKTFAGTELFKENELLEFKTELLRREKIIASHNAKLLIAIVPNKANIYPEFMPDHLVKSEHFGYGRQMHHYLKEYGLPVVDLYTALEKNKTNHHLYFKTDNHWNDLGAFIAANTLLKAMGADFAGIELMDTLTCPIKTKIEKAGSIAEMLSVENEMGDFNYSPLPRNGFKSTLITNKKYKVITGFPYPWEYEQRYHQNDSTLPNVLVIRDSFGKRFVPYLAEQCNNCTAIWDAWHYGLNETIIKDTKPDVVVYLISESQLKNLMKFQKEEKH